MKYKIDYDVDACFWCRSCELVCSLYHEGECNPSLSRIKISLDLFQQKAEAIVCHQCENAKCIVACPVEGAMNIDEGTGSVTIDEEKCVRCGNCAEACPFNSGEIIKLSPLKGKFIKCDLCGGDPQCVEICPTRALRYVQY